MHNVKDLPKATGVSLITLKSQSLLIFSPPLAMTIITFNVIL